MSDLNQASAQVANAVDLENLIERMVAHQIEAMEAVVESGDLSGGHSAMASVVASFGPDIQFRVDVSPSRHLMIGVEAVKIRGFWSEGGVRGGLNINLAGKPSLNASVSTSSGGEQLDDITEAQAYINKGKAIQIVAEAIDRAENNPALPEQMRQLRSLYAALDDIEREQKAAAREAEKAALEAELSANEDLLVIENTDGLVDALRSACKQKTLGEKVQLVFRTSNPTAKSGLDAMKAVAVFNASTAKRTMVAQFLGHYPQVDALARQPQSGRGSLEKLTCEELKMTLSLYRKVFVSRSLTDPELITVIERL